MSHNHSDRKKQQKQYIWTWNDLPDNVTSAESLSIFRQRLKTHLFTESFSDYFLD